MFGLYTKKQIDKDYVSLEKYEKLRQESDDLKGREQMQIEIFKLITDVVYRWRDNKIGNLRAINTISRMMLGKKEKDTK